MRRHLQARASASLRTLTGPSTLCSHRCNNNAAAGGDSTNPNAKTAGELKGSRFSHRRRTAKRAVLRQAETPAAAAAAAEVGVRAAGAHHVAHTERKEPVCSRGLPPLPEKESPLDATVPPHTSPRSTSVGQTRKPNRSEAYTDVQRRSSASPHKRYNTTSSPEPRDETYAAEARSVGIPSPPDLHTCSASAAASYLLTLRRAYGLSAAKRSTDGTPLRKHAGHFLYQLRPASSTVAGVSWTRELAEEVLHAAAVFGMRPRAGDAIDAAAAFLCADAHRDGAFDNKEPFSSGPSSTEDRAPPMPHATGNTGTDAARKAHAQECIKLAKLALSAHRILKSTVDSMRFVDAFVFPHATLPQDVGEGMDIAAPKERGSASSSSSPDAAHQVYVSMRDDVLQLDRYVSSTLFPMLVEMFIQLCTPSCPTADRPHGVKDVPTASAFDSVEREAFSTILSVLNKCIGAKLVGRPSTPLHGNDEGGPSSLVFCRGPVQATYEEITLQQMCFTEKESSAESSPSPLSGEANSGSREKSMRYVRGIPYDALLSGLERFVRGLETSGRGQALHARQLKALGASHSPTRSRDKQMMHYEEGQASMSGAASTARTERPMNFNVDVLFPVVQFYSHAFSFACLADASMGRCESATPPEPTSLAPLGRSHTEAAERALAASLSRLVWHLVRWAHVSRSYQIAYAANLYARLLNWSPPHGEADSLALRALERTRKTLMTQRASVVDVSAGGSSGDVSPLGRQSAGRFTSRRNTPSHKDDQTVFATAQSVGSENKPLVAVQQDSTTPTKKQRVSAPSIEGDYFEAFSPAEAFVELCDAALKYAHMFSFSDWSSVLPALATIADVAPRQVHSSHESASSASGQQPYHGKAVTTLLTLDMARERLVSAVQLALMPKIATPRAFSGLRHYSFHLSPPIHPAEADAPVRSPRTDQDPSDAFIHVTEVDDEEEEDVHRGAAKTSGDVTTARVKVIGPSFLAKRVQGGAMTTQLTPAELLTICGSVERLSVTQSPPRALFSVAGTFLLSPKVFPFLTRSERVALLRYALRASPPTDNLHDHNGAFRESPSEVTSTVVGDTRGRSSSATKVPAFLLRTVSSTAWAGDSKESNTGELVCGKQADTLLEYAARLKQEAKKHEHRDDGAAGGVAQPSDADMSHSHRETNTDAATPVDSAPLLSEGALSEQSPHYMTLFREVVTLLAELLVRMPYRFGAPSPMDFAVTNTQCTALVLSLVEALWMGVRHGKEPLEQGEKHTTVSLRDPLAALVIVRYVSQWLRLAKTNSSSHWSARDSENLHAMEEVGVALGSVVEAMLHKQTRDTEHVLGRGGVSFVVEELQTTLLLIRLLERSQQMLVEASMTAYDGFRAPRDEVLRTRLLQDVQRIYFKGFETEVTDALAKTVSEYATADVLADVFAFSRTEEIVNSVQQKKHIEALFHKTRYSLVGWNLLPEMVQIIRKGLPEIFTTDSTLQMATPDALLRDLLATMENAAKLTPSGRPTFSMVLSAARAAARVDPRLLGDCGNHPEVSAMDMLTASCAMGPVFSDTTAERLQAFIVHNAADILTMERETLERLELASLPTPADVISLFQILLRCHAVATSDPSTGGSQNGRNEPLRTTLMSLVDAIHERARRKQASLAAEADRAMQERAAGRQARQPARYDADGDVVFEHVTTHTSDKEAQSHVARGTGPVTCLSVFGPATLFLSRSASLQQVNALLANLRELQLRSGDAASPLVTGIYNMCKPFLEASVRLTGERARHAQKQAGSRPTDALLNATHTRLFAECTELLTDVAPEDLLAVVTLFYGGDGDTSGREQGTQRHLVGRDGRVHTGSRRSNRNFHTDAATQLAHVESLLRAVLVLGRLQENPNVYLGNSAAAGSAALSRGLDGEPEEHGEDRDGQTYHPRGVQRVQGMLIHQLREALATAPSYVRRKLDAGLVSQLLERSGILTDTRLGNQLVKALRAILQAALFSGNRVVIQQPSAEWLAQTQRYHGHRSTSEGISGAQLQTIQSLKEREQSTEVAFVVHRDAFPVPPPLALQVIHSSRVPPSATVADREGQAQSRLPEHLPEAFTRLSLDGWRSLMGFTNSSRGHVSYERQRHATAIRQEWKEKQGRRKERRAAAPPAEQQPSVPVFSVLDTVEESMQTIIGDVLRGGHVLFLFACFPQSYVKEMRSTLGSVGFVTLTVEILSVMTTTCSLTDRFWLDAGAQAAQAAHKLGGDSLPQQPSWWLGGCADVGAREGQNSGSKTSWHHDMAHRTCTQMLALLAEEDAGNLSRPFDQLLETPWLQPWLQCAWDLCTTAAREPSAFFDLCTHPHEVAANVHGKGSAWAAHRLPDEVRRTAGSGPSGGAAKGGSSTPSARHLVFDAAPIVDFLQLLERHQPRLHAIRAQQGCGQVLAGNPVPFASEDRQTSSSEPSDRLSALQNASYTYLLLQYLDMIQRVWEGEYGNVSLRVHNLGRMLEYFTDDREAAPSVMEYNEMMGSGFCATPSPASLPLRHMHGSDKSLLSFYSDEGLDSAVAERAFFRQEQGRLLGAVRRLLFPHAPATGVTRAPGKPVSTAHATALPTHLSQVVQQANLAEPQGEGQNALQTRQRLLLLRPKDLALLLRHVVKESDSRDGSQEFATTVLRQDIPFLLQAINEGLELADGGDVLDVIRTLCPLLDSLEERLRSERGSVEVAPADKDTEDMGDNKRQQVSLIRELRRTLAGIPSVAAHDVDRFTRQEALELFTRLHASSLVSKSAAAAVRLALTPEQWLEEQANFRESVVALLKDNRTAELAALWNSDLAPTSVNLVSRSDGAPSDSQRACWRQLIRVVTFIEVNGL